MVSRAVLTIAALAGVVPVIAQAQGAAPALDGTPRAGLIEPIESAIAERIAGQTSDLGWELVSIDPGLAVAPGHSAVAAQLARAHRLEALIWTELASGELRLWLLQPARGRMLTRAFAITATSLDVSSASEALALVVRSALQAAREGHAIGAPVAVQPDARAPARSSEADSGAVAPPAANVAVEPDTKRATWSLETGWFLAADGVSEPAQHGPELRAGVAAGWPELGLAVQYGVGAAADDLATRLTIARHALLADVMLPLLEHPRFGVAVGPRLGAVMFARTTEATVAELVPASDARKVGFAAGASARARWAVASAAGFALGLSAQARALALPAPPILQYRLSGERVVRRVAWLEFEGFVGIWCAWRGADAR